MLMNKQSKFYTHGDFTIRKDIDVPNENRGRYGSKYPFRVMEVGDSFFIDKENFSYHHVFAKKNKGFKFTARTVTENGALGKRIWRTA